MKIQKNMINQSKEIKKEQAKLMYYNNVPIHDISKIINIPSRTVYFWKTSSKWKKNNSNSLFKKSNKNNFIGLDIKELEKRIIADLFDYQLLWFKNRHRRTRNILKSRQIGATWYFAREALFNAISTGENQIFLSASKNQANIFKSYIEDFAQKSCGIEVGGKEHIKLKTDFGVATLYFLSTNAKTAQGYSGHVYIDEYCWIHDFPLLKKLASAMATHKNWRKTFFTTPSYQKHGGYKFWYDPNTNKEQLKKGVLCQDGQWRHIVDIHDAMKNGCDLFDIEILKKEYSTRDFNNLYLCQFIDQFNGVFATKDLQKCLVKPNWFDYQPNCARPFGDHSVWIGYDPSRTIDGAAIIIVAPPKNSSDSFRVLDRILLFNTPWHEQANYLKQLCNQYQVDYIGIDVTGNGSGVFEMVKNFFPLAVPITYNPLTKNQMVLKAKDIISKNRIVWNESYKDISAGFLSIESKISKQSTIIYTSNRTTAGGHADSAWALMHVLINEPLDYATAKKSTYFF